MQRARPRVVLQLVSMHAWALLLLLAAPVPFAIAEGEHAFALALAIPGCLPLACVVFMGKQAVRQPRQIEAVVSVAIVFILGASLTVPAFAVAGYPAIDAVFEAVSGITTTGLTTFSGLEALPRSVHFLRFWLQWSGGFAFAAIAVALIVGPGVVAIRLGLADGPGQSLVGSAQSRARLVLGVYLAMTGSAVVSFALIYEDPIDGALTALAAVSTGGFAVSQNSLALETRLVQGATLCAMLLGATSITLLAKTLKNGIREVLGDAEFSIMLCLIGAAFALVVLFEALLASELSAWDALFTVVSAQSTAGFSTVSMTQFSNASLLTLIAIMAIGGSLGSTAGGIKVFRAWFATSAVRLVLRRTAMGPQTVSALRIYERRADPAEGTRILAMIFLYLGFALLLWLALLLAEYAPLPALFETVSAFSTVGLSAGIVSPDLDAGLKLAFVAAMLLGRLEFLALIALFSANTWTKERT